jgi:mercuric ion transport protein
MTEDARPERGLSLSSGDRFCLLGLLALAAGGAAAGFGAAACCAIPMLLGTIGLDTLRSAVFTPAFAPYQTYLVATAFVCLIVGAGLLWWRRACACGTTRLTTAVTVIGLTLGAVLLALDLAAI